jgi:hypothetical protein
MPLAGDWLVSARKMRLNWRGMTVSGRRELLDGQRRVEVLFRIGQRALNAIGLGVHLQQRRVLGLAAGPAITTSSPKAPTSPLGSRRRSSSPKYAQRSNHCAARSPAAERRVHNGRHLLKDQFVFDYLVGRGGPRLYEAAMISSGGMTSSTAAPRCKPRSRRSKELSSRAL